MLTDGHRFEPAGAFPREALNKMDDVQGWYYEWSVGRVILSEAKVPAA